MKTKTVYRLTNFLISTTMIAVTIIIMHHGITEGPIHTFVDGVLTVVGAAVSGFFVWCLVKD
jgi:hypothetical protein